MRSVRLQGHETLAHAAKEANIAALKGPRTIGRHLKPPSFAFWLVACSGGARTLRKAGDWATAHSSAEPDREMKATILLVVLAFVCLAAFAWAPAALAAAGPAGAEHPARAAEPVWMLLSGATLLGVASVVRRYVP